jgi:hypothetical protein
MPRHKLPTHKLATAPRAGRVVALLTAVCGVIAALTLVVTNSSAARGARTVALDQASLSARSSWHLAARWRHHHVRPSPSPSSSAPSTAPSSPSISPSPTTTPTSSPTPTPSSPQTTPSTSVQPNGVPGNWSLKFDDEFSGTSLDTSKWDAFNFACPLSCHNNVGLTPANVTEGNGVLSLRLSTSTEGALVCSSNVPGDCQSATPAGWALPVGGFAEARISSPGSGTTVYNWPAWWACQMPGGWCSNNAGEIDIAEGLGTLTVNYHSPSANTGYGTIPGIWAAGFHTYGVYRSTAHTDMIYYDGKLVKTVTTSDNGGPEDLILEASEASGRTQQIPSTIQVDYVRGWTGAPS